MKRNGIKLYIKKVVTGFLRYVIALSCQSKVGQRSRGSCRTTMHLNTQTDVRMFCTSYKDNRWNCSCKYPVAVLTSNLLHLFPSFVSFLHTTKRIKTQTSQNNYSCSLRGGWCCSIFPSPLRFLRGNCICAYLCMVGQPYRCSSVSFINLTAFFLLRKITFIISVSNTYWPRVSLWHIPRTS